MSASLVNDTDDPTWVEIPISDSQNFFATALLELQILQHGLDVKEDWASSVTGGLTNDGCGELLGADTGPRQPDPIMRVRLDAHGRATMQASIHATGFPAKKRGGKDRCSVVVPDSPLAPGDYTLEAGVRTAGKRLSKTVAIKIKR
ncbi:MAG: hypothetical protein JWO36_2915 [Myxococcales bacterium]|nr:hypothetical protein [Myxococcales bacterium]